MLNNNRSSINFADLLINHSGRYTYPPKKPKWVEKFFKTKQTEYLLIPGRIDQLINKIELDTKTKLLFDKQVRYLHHVLSVAAAISVMYSLGGNTCREETARSSNESQTAILSILPFMATIMLMPTVFLLLVSCVERQENGVHYREKLLNELNDFKLYREWAETPDLPFPFPTSYGEDRLREKLNEIIAINSSTITTSEQSSNPLLHF